MKLTESTMKKGKSVEHFLISEFLKRGLDVYLLVVDVHGIDILVRSKTGRTAEIQVARKSCFPRGRLPPKGGKSKVNATPKTKP